MTLREGGFYDTTKDLEAFDNAMHGWRTVDGIVPMSVKWLWLDRVPFGMTTVLGGPPGAGKSTILYDLAASTSREGNAVLIITAEDHHAAVVRPRLEAASARLDKIHVRTDPIELPADVDVIKAYARDVRAALVIIDPLVAFIGDDVNTHRDHHVRRVLAPLGEMAESTDTALVVVIHTNKGTAGDPLMRISGSIGFTGAARSVLVAVQDPNDDTRCILAVVKSNLARFPTPQAYRIENALAGTITASRIKWLGDAPEVDVHELLAVPDRRERKGEEAREFLIEAGVRNVARPAKDLETEAEAAGLAKRTVQQARKDMGIPAWRTGFGAEGIWRWGPKPDDTKDANSKAPPNRQIPAPMAQPAETDPPGPIGAGGVVAGDGPCPSCGALSSEKGYRGHGEGCPFFYEGVIG
jgi:AAA domain